MTCGRIEAGTLSAGQRVVFVPSGEVAEVKAVQRNGKSLSEAVSGQNVGFCLKAPQQLSKQPRRGDVVCDASEPVLEVRCGNVGICSFCSQHALTGQLQAATAAD